MKVVIAPDSFKESLPGMDVAAALGEGVVEVVPAATIDLCPMSDGGEGMVSAMVAATGGTFLTADVFDPLGAPIRARLGLLGGAGGAGLPGQVGLSGAVALPDQPDSSSVSRIAVIEMAAASGLTLIPPDRRDPMRTTTFGTGKLILAALDAGATEVILGIGGSATVDGGAGCAQALGVSFTGIDGQALICGLAGDGLADIEDIDISGRDPRIGQAHIRVACDVTNPLIGPDGAAAVYAPQKGATPEMVERLERGLAHLADVIRRKMGIEVADVPGAGAAGGLGAGLIAFAGAELASGVAVVAEAVDLERRLAGADLCITGEGKLDTQSRFGKTTVGVAKIARKAGVPVICIPGQADPDAPATFFDDIRPLADAEVSVRKAMTDPQPLLRKRAAEAMRRFLKRR